MKSLPPLLGPIDGWLRRRPAWLSALILPLSLIVVLLVSPLALRLAKPVRVEQIAAAAQGPYQPVDLTGLSINPAIKPAWMEQLYAPGLDALIALEEDHEVRTEMRAELLRDELSGRLDYFAAQRAYPLTTLPPNARVAAFQQAESMLPVQAAAQLPRWQNIGPAPMIASSAGRQSIEVTGRVRALAVDPRDSNVVYLGAAQGGVWKTTNGGASWTPLTDDQASLSIAALAIDPTNPEIVYAGTGEPTPGMDQYYGAGILKTTDGGATWTRLGAEVFGGVAVAKLVIDPRNSSVIYAASSIAGVPGATRPPLGIFKSNDGGQSWEALLSCPGCPGASDLVQDPQTPDTLYAAFWEYGLFKSVNGGQSWSQPMPFNPQQNPIRRVLLTISPAQPQTLYASFHVNIPGQFDGAAVFKTVDGAASWNQVSLGGYNYCGSQCWYSNVIAVHPTNPNMLYLGGMAHYLGESEDNWTIRRVVVRTADSGNAWDDLSDNSSPQRTLHPDMHVIVFDPQKSDTIWIGNDGGVWRSTNGGNTWEHRNTNLATLQFTGIAIHPTNSNILQGGMQDNNKAYTSDGGANPAWIAADVGDGGFAAIDPFNPQIFYGTRFNKSFQRNDQGLAFTGWWPLRVDGIAQDDRSLFYPPFAVDPSSEGVLYFGTYRLYRTTNRGNSWQPISPDLSKGQGNLSTIAVAPGNPQVIYAGASDGNIQVTTDGGANWTNVTRAPLPNRFVSKIVVAPGNTQQVYAVFNGFNTHTPQTPGHVFKSSDGGATWSDISANLPDVPVAAVVLDRLQPNTIYLGTDTGVFRTTDEGQSWLPFNNGLPNVAVVDLTLSGDGRHLIAGTHGRSIYRVTLAGGDQPPGDFRVYLSAVGRGDPVTPPTGEPTATFTPTPTATPVNTNTPTATSTPVTPEGTQLPTATTTNTPTATPSPSPTTDPAIPTPTPTTTPETGTFSDNFGDPNSGWARLSLNQCDLDYTSGHYTIAMKTQESYCVSAAPADAVVDGTYQVVARKESANDGSVYGLFFGADDPQQFNQFYVFWVDPASTSYAVQKRDGGVWTALTQNPANGGMWLSNSTIAGGANTNLLKVRRQGNEIRLYVNGVLIDRLFDNSFPQNGVAGIANWYGYPNTSTATARFDDFRIDRFTVVYADDYSRADSGWFTGTQDVCQANYLNGIYRTATQADYVCVYGAPAPGQANGLFSVEVSRGDTFYQTAYGLIFAIEGEFARFYAYLVIPDSQSYAVARYDHGVWTRITNNPVYNDAWLFSDQINPSTAVNRLAAERDGHMITLYVNDSPLGTVFDFSPFPLSGSGFGVINWSSQFETAIADFDRYQVTAWEPGEAGVVAASPVEGALRSLSLPAFLEPPATSTPVAE